MNKLLDNISRLIVEGDSDYVALDLGESYLKAVYVTDGRIDRFLVQKNNGSPVKLAAAWLKKEGLLSKEVRVSIKGRSTLLRYIPFLKVDKKNLKEVFSYEIAKFIPFNKEEIYFDVFIVDENYSFKEFLVLLAVAKRDLVDSLIKSFSEEKVRLGKITLNNIAIINLFLNYRAHMSSFRRPGESPPRGSSGENNKQSQPRQPTEELKLENVAIVDIGLNTSLLNLIKKDHPCLSREIKVSASDFLQKIVKVKQVSLEEAENFLTDLERPKEVIEIQEILEITEEVAFGLSEEVKNTLDYFEVNWGQRVQAIYLTGGLSKIKGLERVMENSLGVPTRIWDPFEGVHLSVGPDILSFKEMMAVVLGVTL